MAHGKEVKTNILDLGSTTTLCDEGLVDGPGLSERSCHIFTLNLKPRTGETARQERAIRRSTYTQWRCAYLDRAKD